MKCNLRTLYILCDMGEWGGDHTGERDGVAGSFKEPVILRTASAVFLATTLAAFAAFSADMWSLLNITVRVRSPELPSLVAGEYHCPLDEGRPEVTYCAEAASDLSVGAAIPMAGGWYGCGWIS